MSSADPDPATFIAEHGRLRHPPSHPSFNPFRRPTIPVPPPLHYIQRALSVVLIPLRLLLAIIVTIISYTLVKLFGPRVTPHDISNFTATELPSWRRQICIFATKLMARTFLLSLGFWRVHGRDDPMYNAEQACKATILSNHSSLADPCLLAYLFAPSFVAKSEVWAIPGVGRVGAAQHAFYIDRMDNAGVSVTEKMKERQRDLMGGKKIPSVCIFPEGTTTNGRHLLRFRSGAFVAGCPVVPVLIRYRSRWFSPSYETIRTKEYLIGVLSQVVNSVEYYRMPVYFPNEEERKDARLFADNVHRVMLSKSEEVFGVGLISSESNYVDKVEFHSIVRGEKLRKGLRLNMDA